MNDQETNKTNISSSNILAVEEWKAPTMTRIDMKLTMLGENSDTDAMGRSHTG